MDVATEQEHCEVVQTGHKFHIMRKLYPIERLLSVAVLAVVVNGCQQADQTLPFELAEGEGATSTIGSSGGTISVPPAFSLEFPAGSLTGSVSVEVTPRISGPFPGDAGTAVPGSAYDVGPVGTMLVEPATIEIAVDPALLEAGDDVRLSVAVLRQDQSVATFPGTYDLTNGVLRAEIDELGPIAAVVSLDVIAVATGAPPALGGGSIPQPSAPAPSGAAPAPPGGIEFSASCAPDVRQCFSSGIIKIWADQTVQDRMGEELYLLVPEVDVHLDFLNFVNGIPTEVQGTASVGGDLRARFNSAVTGYELDDAVTTGPSASPVPTALQVAGSVMIFGQTTTTGGGVEFSEEVEFGVTGIGTTEMMTIRVESEVNFDNDDGTTTTGIVVAHIRLRVPQS